MKQFTCIICPNGCDLMVDDNNNVSGNSCPRGLEFALQEVNNPMRVVTSTLKSSFLDIPVVSCKTDKPVAKDKIFDVIKEINKAVISKRVPLGTVIIENVANTGANVITTKKM